MDISYRGLNQYLDDDEEERPPLPVRPLSVSPEPSPSILITSHENENDEVPLIRRKPPLPPRPKALDKKSYEPVEMKQMQISKTSFEEETDEEKPKLLPPKAFHKTHLLWGYNFGYWRMPARHFSIFTILFLTTFLPLYYSAYGFSSIQDNGGPFTFDCTGSESGWSFVGINLRFGELSYGKAKIIDLAWNWVVGRGLQGLLTLLAYRVFQDGLLRAAEMTPLPYEIYASLALYSTKLDVLWQLLKGIGRYGNWRTKAIFVWLLISTVYLAVFPSLMDVCSGYDSFYISNFRWPDGTVVTTDSLSNWESDPNIVSVAILCCQWDVSYASNTLGQYNMSCYNSRWEMNTTGYNDCVEYASFGPLELNSSSQGTSNTTSLYYWVNTVLNSSWWSHYETDPITSQMGYWGNWDFYPSNSSNFPCVAANNTYQWGFSFEWLFVAAIVNSVWLYGLWILWLDCDTNSEFCRKRRRLGLWRSIADISEAMRKDLGPNICAYDEKELAEALEKCRPVMYYSASGEGEGQGEGEDKVGHIGLSSRRGPRLRLEWGREYGKVD